MPPRDTATNGRINQRLRTRKDLLRAAARLLKEGRTPTMDEVAAEAMVSRATVYRYFSTLEALLVEAPLDGAVPDPDELFADDASTDPADRADKAEAALHAMTFRNETQLRLMLAESLRRSVVGGEDSGGSPGERAGSLRDEEGQKVRTTPLRQNRRGLLIEAALAPARSRFSPAAYKKLCAALSLVFGTESMIVFRDVLPLDERTARRMKSWTIRALIRAALEDSQQKGDEREG